MTNTFRQKQNISTARVFVGLSGGVDSATAAALLKAQGYDVVGVFIRIVVPGYPCTAGKDRIDAMRAASHLKIPFIEVDFSKEYQQEVFEPSLKEFEEGETPNPDVLCNRQIKFGKFFTYCKSRGADLVATGHYTRVKDGLLYAGRDTDKDQSYFLWSIREEVLRHTLFPVGDKTKTEVRVLAKKFGLPNAQRPDSQGLCFLGPISMEEMLARELKLEPGEVVDEEGRVVGTHEGAARYTLGQRHGFTLIKKNSNTPPLYVIGKDAKKNTITVSPSRFPRLAKKTKVVLREMNWIGKREEGSCQARFRYRQKLIPAQIHKDSSVMLDEPHYVPIGQSLVLYRGDRCLGGGIVDRTVLEP